MDYNQDENELYRSSHLMILLSYTLFSVMLSGEAILMSWERWAIVLVMSGVAAAWIIHIRHMLSEYGRLWIYSLLMMATFFFYGIHPTSMYDMSTVMIVAIMIYTMTGHRPLITMCQVTYYITMAYDIVSLIISGETIDALSITRILVHICMILMAGWVGRTIIDKWDKVMGNSHEEIKLLKEQTDRLNHFLANVSHEIRTPINAVMGLSSVLEKEDLPEGIRENVDAISQAGHRVAEQMGDILDYTEIDMNKLSVSHEVYMISSLINDVLTQLSFAENYGLDLVIDMDSAIPAELIGDAEKIKKILWHLIMNGYKFTKEGGVGVHIYAVKREYGINLVLEVKDTGNGIAPEEKEHIYEGFYQSDSGHTRTAGGLGLGLSIVNGFVKAMSGVMIVESTGEGTCVRVSLPQQIEDPDPCLSVRERDKCKVAGFLGFMTTGNSGVREFYMEMIGHLVTGLSVPFSRVESMDELERLVDSAQISHLFVGTGEYLENREYIDSLTDRMNVAVVADIGFTGEVGKDITLLAKPFYGGQIANFLNHAFEAGTFRVEEKMTCPGLKVLVVDDEPMNLLVARGIFETYGMIVKTAPGGEESVRMCAEEDYDVVFMDHMMPGMDGVEAMKKIKAQAVKTGKDIIVIALTANAISSAKEMFLSEGFDGFVPKPVDLSELERVLKRVLPVSAIVYSKDSTEKDKGEKNTESANRHVIPGLDMDAGIKYCSNDEAFYRQLVLEYASDYENKIKALQAMYASNDFVDYSIRVHAIKSTSKMIGAFALSETARKLEEAAKGDDIETIKELHPGFISDYAKLLRGIHDHYDTHEDVAVKKQSDDDILEFSPEDHEDEKGGEA